MLENKKSAIESLESIVRLVITISVILLIIFPFWDTIYAYLIKPLLNPSTEYTKSFEDFVNNINKMKLERETFSLKLKEGTAIIGFSKGADRYECIECYTLGRGENKPTIVFNKPSDIECSDSACICLCSEGFKFLQGQGFPKFAQCTKLKCKKIEQIDIVGKTIIKKYPSTNIIITTLGSGRIEYWKNGFLFANNIDGTNGLRTYYEEYIAFVVEKKNNMIGVCNFDMMDYNKKEFNSDNCIITEQDVKK